MARKARLRHPTLGVTLTLPWWPSEVSRDLTVRRFAELERASKRPLVVAGGLTSDSYSVSYTARNDALYRSVQSHVRLLARLAKHPDPVMLRLADSDRGLWHIESASVIELEWAPNGDPSVVDVSLTLKRAGDATIKVGPVKRRRNKKPKKR